MPPTPTDCLACGRPLPGRSGRCPACKAWQPGALWDRGLYYGFVLLTALAMGLRWWLRRSTGAPPSLGELRLAWLHPLVVVPLALSAVFAVRVWKRR